MVDREERLPQLGCCAAARAAKLTPNRRFVVHARRCIAYRKTGELEDAARDCDRAVGLSGSEEFFF